MIARLKLWALAACAALAALTVAFLRGRALAAARARAEARAESARAALDTTRRYGDAKEASHDAGSGDWHERLRRGK